VASFAHTVELARPPGEVFPWLLEEEHVRSWTSHLRAYQRVGDGPLGVGARIRQVLDVSGRTIDVELEITRYEPPHAADTRFSTNGIDVVNGFRLEPAGAGSRLTQSVEAEPASFSARFLVPVLRPHLERKVTEDLERLREKLAR
jgi:hypothetical protein